MNNIRISDGPIYIDLPYPDTRRKVYVSFKYNEKFIKQSVLIQNHWDTLDRIINHLKQTPIISKLLADVAKDNLSLYLYTTDDKLIQCLKTIINDQKLVLKLEPTKSDVDYSKNVEPVVEKPKPAAVVLETPADPFTGPFRLWAKDYIADSAFLDQCADIQERYPDRIQIGEVYPYRFRFYWSSTNDGKNLGIWLYFVDVPGESKPELTVHSNNRSLEILIYRACKEKLTDVSAIGDTIDYAIDQFKKFYSGFDQKFSSIPYLDDDIVRLFPSTFKVCPTITKSNFYQQCFKDELILSQKSGLPVSICKKELMNSNCVFIRSFLSLKKLYPTHFNGGNVNYNASKDANFKNAKDDIRNYKFKLQGEIECPICYCDEDVSNCIQLTCGHTLCKTCFQLHVLSNQSVGKGNVGAISCSVYGCSNILDSVTIASHLNEEQWKRWNNQMFDEYNMVSGSRRCRVKECGRVVYYYPNYDQVIPFAPCGCMTTLCLSCGIPTLHWPHSCQVEDITSDKFKDISSMNWMVSTTTVCPRCRMPVERSSGCNHLQCRCGHAFCYGCGIPYTGMPHTCSNDAKTRTTAKAVIEAFNLDISADTLLKIMKAKSAPILMTFQDSLMKYTEVCKVPALVELSKKINKLFTELVNKSNSSKKNGLTSDISELLEEMWNLTGKRTKKRLRTSIRQSGQYEMVKTLMCEVALNGYNPVITQVFVNRNMESFKLDLLIALNKHLIQKKTINLEDANETQKTLRKIKFYSVNGFEILSPADISLNEKIFVTLDAETFIQPKTKAEGEVNAESVDANDVNEPSHPNVLDKQKEMLKMLIKLEQQQQQQQENLKQEVIQELIDLRNNPIYREETPSDNTNESLELERNDEAIAQAFQDVLDEMDEIEDTVDDDEDELIQTYDKYEDYCEKNYLKPCSFKDDWW